MNRTKISVLLGALCLALWGTEFSSPLVAGAALPDEPVMVSPANGAIGVSTAPTLTSQVTDAAGGNLTVTTSLRRVTAEEFTIIVLPDTQYYSENYPATFTAQTQWIVDNREARNIVFVTHEGDIVQTASKENEWQRADTSMSLLEVAGIPFGAAPGNHDQPTSLYNNYFGIDRYEGRSYYGGYYGSNNDNNYQLFSAGGMDFIAVHLDYCPSEAIVDWASDLMQTHANRIGMLTTHAYLNSSGGRISGCRTQYMFDNLAVPNPNVHFMLSGHISAEARRSDIVGTRTIHQLLADYQERPNGGDGWLRIMRFVPAENKVYVQTYSPTKNQFETDANSQFTLDFPMASSFQPVGTAVVPAGTQVNMTPAALAPFTTYEWKVTVTNDIGQTRTGATWTFTTGASGPPNDPPSATPQSVTVPEDASTFVTLAGTDPNGNSLTYQVLTQPTHGTLSGVVPNLTYSPDGNYAGSDSFAFRVNDGQYNSSAATVTITVQPVNDPPTAVADSHSVPSGTTLSVSSPGLLGNDADIDGPSLTAALGTGPSHGLLTLNANGSFSYTPTTGYSGPDSFTYTASDGFATTTPATVTITVTPPPPPPGSGNLKAITFENGSVTHAATGADAVVGAVALESAAPIKGSYAARIPDDATYLKEGFPATADLYVSFYLRVTALPTSDASLLQILNGSSTVGTLQLRSSGKLRLRNNSTTVGSESAVLTVGQVYRIGVRQKARVGSSNNGVLEAFLVTGESAFGAAFAALSNGSWTTGATELRLGSTSSAVVNLVVDDVKLDSTAMPLPAPGPTAPTGLTALASSATTVNLLWTDASADEASFLIERAVSTGSFNQIAIVPADTTGYADTTATPATAYSYRIRGVNASNVGHYSNVATATTLDVPPAAPSGLAATPSSSTVALTWTDGSSNETRFALERAGSDNVFAPLVTLAANTTSYTDPTVTAATAYSYRVRAGNSAGDSTFSPPVSVTTLPPPPPPGSGNLKAITFENGSVTHAVTGADAVVGAVALESAAPIKGSYAARIPDDGTYLKEGFAATADLYVSFYLRVTALPPSDASLLQIRNGSSTVGTLQLRSSGKLRLRNNSTTVGSESAVLTVGQVYRIGVHQKARVGSSNNGVLEAFLVTGENAFGAAFAALSNGSWTTGATELRLGSTSSAVVNLVVDDVKLDSTAMPLPAPGPTAPTGLTASATSATAVQLGWGDVSSDETAFHIERAGSNGVYAEIGTVAANATSYADETASPATTYSYRVRGKNGGNFGSYSNVAAVTTPDVLPAAPTGLGASGGSVVLSWSDASSNETAFSLERADDGVNFAELVELPANTITYTDHTVASSSTYKYRVRARNSVGYSDYSNVVEFTTPAPPPPPDAPSGLGASAPSGSQVQLSWTDNSASESLFRIERAPQGGAFVEIATVAASVTTYADNTVAPDSSYRYQVRASNAQGFSGYSNEATITTPPPSSGIVLKLMTFESGTVTDPATGADSVTGTVIFETATPLKGTRSAKFNASAYLQEDFTATDDLTVSFYVRIPSLPSSDIRIFLISNAGNTVGNLYLRATGQLRLRNNSTVIGADSPALAPNTTYRVMVRQRGSPRVLEAFLAQGDDPFGLAFASSTATTWSGSADRIRIGGTNGTFNGVLDDIRLEAGP